MIIGSISEDKSLEKRISITPEISRKYISNGFKVKIEKGIADHLGIKDDEFIKEGCSLDTKENVLKESGIYYERNSYESLLSLLTNTLNSDLHFLWKKQYESIQKYDIEKNMERYVLLYLNN